MKSQTEALLQQCRVALLQHSNEHIAALLKCWFENMIGDEDSDEEMDDLCLQLGYRVRSYGAENSYATYTSWWEVEGYQAPDEGEFICVDKTLLHRNLLILPIEQFNLVMELAYQELAAPAETQDEPHLSTGHTLLRVLAAWLINSTPNFDMRLEQLTHSHESSESKAQRRAHEQELIAYACQQGYVVVYPDTPPIVTDTFRRWCKEGNHPYIYVEVTGLQLARVIIDIKTLSRGGEAIATNQIQERLQTLAEPYIARSQAQHHQAHVHWISRKILAIEAVLTEDTASAAQEMVTVWSEILEVEKIPYF